MKWFKHDSRANRDAKIEKLLLRFGSDGYSLYWLCLELIADRLDDDNVTFELEHDAETLGLRLKVDTLRVEEIMKWMVREGLFESTGEKITCLKLAKRLDASLLRSPELLKIRSSFRELPGTSGKPQEGSMKFRDRREENRREENKNTEDGAPASPPAMAHPSKSPKHKHGVFSNVLLTDDELTRLRADFPNADRLINHLSEYREMKGYSCKRDYLALRKWVVDAVKEDDQRKAKLAGTPLPVELSKAPEKLVCSHCGTEGRGSFCSNGACPTNNDDEAVLEWRIKHD